jgi:ATP-dependent Lon protease
MSEEKENAFDLARALEDVPIFPLPQAVLFPGALLPLHIFEPRYRAMLAHCLETHRAMVITRIADPSDVDAKGEPRFARVAGLGQIVEHQGLPDGRSNILLLGRARVALEERAVDTPFRRARATLIADVPGVVTETDRAALVAAATSFASELHKHADMTFSLPPHAPVEAIADVCAHHLLFDAAVRQAVLEERDIGARVRRVATELALQQRALQQQAGRPLN